MKSRASRAELMALAALALGPLAWSLDTLASYFISYRTDAMDSQVSIWWMTLVALAVCSAGVALALLARRQLVQKATHGRAWVFLTELGLGLNGLFMLTLLANALPKLILGNGG